MLSKISVLSRSTSFLPCYAFLQFMPSVCFLSLPDDMLSVRFIRAFHLFQLNMLITSIIILCAIAMILYKLIQSLEHSYKKKK